MQNEIFYMLTVVAVCFAVNFLLRALPFILFAGKTRNLPAWVEKLGGLVSPVIIFSLIIYSYSGLEWRTAWPYLAGVVTVSVYLVFKNSLAGILAGTILYMTLLSLFSGCVSVPSQELLSKAEKPIVKVTSHGIKFLDRYVEPGDVPKLLQKYNVSKAKTLHIYVEPDFTDRRALWVFKHNYLTRYGYSKSVWVGPRMGISGDSSIIPDSKGKKGDWNYGGRRIKR
jgi:branched-subunit amino acid transport protein AzlD